MRETMSNPSIVVFSTFWDVNKIVGTSYFLANDRSGKNTYKINLLIDAKTNEPRNFEVRSVALSNPTIKNPAWNKIGRLDFFCPTYEILNKYHGDGNWEEYQKCFKILMQKRKKEIRKWLDSLKPDWVYFLCCWENTSNGANCHRQLLYKDFCNSKVAADKIIPFYRHGDGKNCNSIMPDASLGLADVNEQLIRTPNDPNLIISTSHAFGLDPGINVFQQIEVDVPPRRPR
jgi:hypothetical protein